MGGASRCQGLVAGNPVSALRRHQGLRTVNADLPGRTSEISPTRMPHTRDPKILSLRHTSRSPSRKSLICRTTQHMSSSILLPPLPVLPSALIVGVGVPHPSWSAGGLAAILGCCPRGESCVAEERHLDAVGPLADDHLGLLAHGTQHSRSLPEAPTAPCSVDTTRRDIGREMQKKKLPCPCLLPYLFLGHRPIETYLRKCRRTIHCLHGGMKQQKPSVYHSRFGRRGACCPGACHTFSSNGLPPVLPPNEPDEVKEESRGGTGGAATKAVMHCKRAGRTA